MEVKDLVPKPDDREETKESEEMDKIDKEKILELFKGIEIVDAGGYRDYWPPCHAEV